MRATIVLVVPLVTALCAVPAKAQQPSGKELNVKIGVLSDMSGLYADIGGPGSVVAKMAVEDFNPASHHMKGEIISADHQNKPDIGSSIARRWFDTDQVNAVADVPNHGTMHGAGKFGITSLINLDQLPPTGAVIFAAPLKIADGSGSPLRVIALAPA
jgi:hypothetical protein